MSGNAKSYRRKRKANSVKKRCIGAPLYVVAGIDKERAKSVERLVCDVLGKGLRGEIYVPRIVYKTWYSASEARELFRLTAKKIVSGAQVRIDMPTPSAVFLLYVKACSSKLQDSLLAPFEFWAWPEVLRAPDLHCGTMVHTPNHWSKDPVAASETIVAAVRRLRGTESRWRKVQSKLSEAKNAYRLPPINFYFPEKGTRLRDAYRRLIRGVGEVSLPRLQRVPKGAHRIHGNRHFRDAYTRFFPLGKGEHGVLRSLDAVSSSADRPLCVWLNGAYRFGGWIGDFHEHYDVQRLDGNVSPPDVFCAKRNCSVRATCPYVNIFVNDTVRDAELFKI